MVNGIASFQQGTRALSMAARHAAHCNGGRLADAARVAAWIDTRLKIRVKTPAPVQLAVDRQGGRRRKCRQGHEIRMNKIRYLKKTGYITTVYYVILFTPPRPASPPAKPPTSATAPSPHPCIAWWPRTRAPSWRNVKQPVRRCRALFKKRFTRTSPAASLPTASSASPAILAAATPWWHSVASGVASAPRGAYGA